ncbi:MATH and LRR domain-containing protein PFE0570w-like [Plodia interpunctella]|uniref:MATH and LRR domain-containing protein PFE0570w-like n=1 Tax=Plodia interpunctella TaxID=58824 RepID=UPI002367E548|nr:MATH and LRR domain-containing protein PFE0570w-like [Plodia interpunctella]
MEEDVGAKAPVTRLRHRLSVEAEEVKSPSAPSTPSKKRGGRLAAKPQLELIDENSSENTPRKQTRKTAVKEVIEANEEKVLTPSRRSTRIKSNTSIISETPQSFDSPRAKRAARRNSQIGSDNEAPVTPARQSRRTRKDSSTSVDKQETPAKNSAPTVADPIVEEVETDSKNSSTVKTSEKSEITPKRKSPRLLKKEKLGDTIENEEILKENDVINTNKTNDKKISDESFQLLNNLNEQPVYKAHLNNSASSLDFKKTTRNRTKTWSTSENLPIVNYDINKKNKMVIKVKGNDESIIKKPESNNNILEADSSTIKTDNVIEKIDKNVSVNKKTGLYIDNNSSNILNETSNSELSLSNKINNVENTDLNETQKILKKDPVTAVQSFIYYDDSDSDKGKPIVSHRQIESEDQCVPVVPEINPKSIFNQNENDRVSNDTCEPMDIDETIPSNVSLINSSDSKQVKDSLDKSLEIKLTPIEYTFQSPNKSKQGSTSLSISQNNEKTSNENKSTLILSQLKDVSTTDHSLAKSPKTTVEFLSNSVNDMNKEKYVAKKDDYLTSTPLQQKNLKKMAIQINTSVINNSNNGSTNSSLIKKSKINDSKQSNKSGDDTSSEESESEHESKEKSDFLDDEAEEACDDYESGDSQNEEERQYEKENEIVEKGETLDSSDGVSNDTDYEKDSFVVSSDEEDNDLLSGSGDDLTMSDNELTQSKKSKKKFDERKVKEQKKASREMFVARHNISNNSTKSDVTKGKKNRRQRLNSSTLESEEEIVVKSKKSRRMKLDSSQDSSTEEMETNAEVAEGNTSITEESEITPVGNESYMNKEDPLSTNVKSEPQTPLKDMNMSTIPIHDDIEEIRLDQNMSIMETNETSDPLQDESDASSISENMEITSNYDSVLKELNNMKEKKIKTLDMSLNLNKKTKQSANPPIVDNLNLTNTKKSKTTKCDSRAKTTNQAKDTEKNADFEESSSDSIDLQLLFSEDSSDGVKNDQSKTKQETENFIPLKRTEGKTNIFEGNTEDSKDQNQVVGPLMNQSNSESLNISLKKKKKNSSSLTDNITSEKSKISLNTNGEVSMNSVLQISKKKKNKNSIYNMDCLNDETNNSDVQEQLNEKESNQNTSLNTNDKKKKKNSLSLTEKTNQSNQGETVIQTETVFDASNVQNNCSKKNKHSISLGAETENENNEINQNLSINNSLDTSSKKKKKKHSISEDTMKNQDQEVMNIPLDKNYHDNSMNSTLNTSTKKKKKTSISISEDKTDKNTDTSSTLNNSSKKKKKNSISIRDDEIDFGNKSIEVINIEGNSSTSTDLNEVLTESSKKKKKHNSSLVSGFNLTALEDIEDVYDSSKTSAKKKKNKAAALKTTDKVSQDDSDAPEEIPYTSHKNSSAGDLSGHIFIDTEGNQEWNTLISGGSSKKDKKKKSVQDTELEINDYTSLENNSAETTTSKKRKRKSSATSQETITVDPDSINEPSNRENKRKKQKISQSEDTHVSPVEIKDVKKKNKKRKERDEDDENKSAKVFKQNSADKINVPRLPATILNLLEDKPKKNILELKKAKVVSTSQFVVEEAKKRKNKPSNYLEESVYLNDSVEGKKQKGFIRKIPKVLPFVPTATISGSGFTTKFQVNILQKETKFVAQTSNLTGFKNDYLGGKKIKKVGTYELYKSQRNRKLSKF